ncbi:hypothetical protein MKY87_12395 [Paenibacillus sp. FSL R7-0198]|uniref:hypothetical protein n=1 Tax=Paenibacillus sp. FSL R7-0198 TaxID=2921674 RepID=UPI0030FCAAD5
MKCRKSALSQRIIFFLWVIISIVVLIGSILYKPTLTGDGREYLGMTISFKNHLSPELLASDIHERNLVETSNNINYPEGTDYSGYFESKTGTYYSYHFWFYSLLNLVPYSILDAFNLNVLNSFQITNSVLFLIMLLKIIRTSIFKTIGLKIAVLIFNLFSPIILYIHWTHTEVFSYVMIFLGLIYYFEEKPKASVLFFSLAALQSPAISILSLYVLLSELLKEKTNLFKDRRSLLNYLLLGAVSTINIMPFLFYYFHFGEFSLITATGYSSLELITIRKVLSLFFDLNFGLIIYTPVLIISMLYLVIKKHKNAIVMFTLLILMSIVNATQLNWNSGMMYINRYSVWYIPLMIFGVIFYFNKMKIKKLYLIIAIFIFTTGSVTVYCLKQYDYSNYLRFSPVAKLIMNNYPRLSNPVPEIFYERALGLEKMENVKFPISLINSDGQVRKTLDRNSMEEGKEFYYDNGKFNFNLSKNLFTILDLKAGEDIFNEAVSAGFVRGWYSIEGEEYNKYRWMGSISELIFKTDSSKKRMKFSITSFQKDRNITINLNNKKVFYGSIPKDTETKIEVEIDNSGFNYMTIISEDGTDKPSDFLGTNDNRDISFSIGSINLE